jgi:Ala-tRNA(Pro) deacylase
VQHSVNQALHEFLKAEKVSYRIVTHPPTLTSEDSAKARTESLEVGGKALVMKVGNNFQLFVLSAAKRLDSAAAKKHFGVGKIRFATPEELLELTGLVPGAVPPFGRPILQLDLHVDTGLTKNSVVAFNAGLLTESFVLAMDDYLRVAKPTVFAFAKAE